MRLEKKFLLDKLNTFLIKQMSSATSTSFQRGESRSPP